MVGYKELKNLQGRIVLITGASSGMGEQIAYQAAKKGAIVIGCARRIEKLEEVVEGYLGMTHMLFRLTYRFRIRLSVSLKKSNQASDRLTSW